MSLAEKFAPHLPYLRRYARALTGSQSSGDAYVRACLEALVDANDEIDDSLTPRVALYQYFHVIWNTAGGTLVRAAPEANASVRALPSQERQAFLLNSVEGFSETETAIILNRNIEEIGKMLDHALAELENAEPTRVLIVEDEPIIAADIEALVSDLGHVAVGVATTRTEAVEMAKRHEPGLLLCDIQLADRSSGVDAAAEILETLSVPVIFITAFPERLLTGKGVEPTFLITKPFNERTVKAAIGQALFFKNPARISA